MTDSSSSRKLFMYSTTVSDVGTVRSNNQDSSFAGEHLIAICDGMGGHAGGDTASTIAIRSLAHVEHDDLDDDVEAVSSMMETSVMAAHDAIVGKAKRERSLAGMGTTVTTVALVDNYWILAHIGDSRAYLLRNGHLGRMTSDHSYVQHLIDTGRITEAEGRNHPQRNVVMRVLGDFDIDPRPDIAVRRAYPSDRWLLCSDGLCGVLEDSTIEQILRDTPDLEDCAQILVSLALKAGSTDNVTAVVADATLALSSTSREAHSQTPLIGGAASASLEPIADIINGPVASSPALRTNNESPAQRAATLAQDDKNSAINSPRIAQPSSVREETGERATLDTGEIPVVKKSDGRLTADPNDPDVAKAIRNEQLRERQTTKNRHRLTRWIIATIIVLTVASLAVGGAAAYRWSQSSYYLGEADGYVSIYQGVPTNIFGFSLSHEIKRTDIAVSSLPAGWRNQLAKGITMSTVNEAEEHAKLIESEAQHIKRQDGNDTTSGSASSPSSSSSSSSSASPSSSSSSTKGGA
ncbi:PP2C family serine/threonine-protein phosphatase [uncultured Bifidobacterium sp.]|uniref:PP2C family protein-serine/threonine phosphatase n=1 Tax=uncultured Bifidobacterium sp. TaxID=165187 RepID=UPI00260E52A1|nr:PP2C family serine/threonine-protein phosphatase [uncultured Bifidobacterium sp.]